MICRFWWSQQKDEKKMHWVGWEKMTLPKRSGSLGFRDLHSFNLAMLARQAWRLLQAPESLCARVLAVKYYPQGNMLTAQPCGNMSHTWRSIMRGLELLKEGYIWRVGSGDNINMWSDPWIPNGDMRYPITRQGANLLTRVSELIDPVSHTWDEELVRQTFMDTDAKAILRIPL